MSINFGGVVFASPALGFLIKQVHRSSSRACRGPEDDALQAAGVIADLQRTKGAAGADALPPALQGALQSILTMSNTPEMMAMLQAHVGAGRPNPNSCMRTSARACAAHAAFGFPFCG